MVFKVILVITLFNIILSGAVPLDPQTKSNQATYSQSFVRDDVPVSYHYSATHTYTLKPQENIKKSHENILKRHEDFPKLHEESFEINSVRNFEESPFERLNNNTIQFAPLPSYPRENTPPASDLYTSIVLEPATEYEKVELPENSTKYPLNLEPKSTSLGAKHVSASTYRPHINLDIKLLQSYPSHKSHLRPKYYGISNMQGVATTPKFEMAGLHQLALFHQLQQQQHGQPKYITPTTTENPKLSRMLNLDVRVLQKQGIPNIRMPHELTRNTPFQPIPRIAYHSLYNMASDKSRPKHTHYNQIYLNKPITYPFNYSALDTNQIKPNVQL